MKIRLATKQDIPKLAEIYALVYEKFDIGEKWTKETALNYLSYWFEKQPDLFFVAEDKELIGAFVAGIKPWWDGNHIYDGEFFIHPDFQKKGIGTKMLKKLCEHALKKYNVIAIDELTFKKTKFPLSWYISLGFKKNQDLTIISGDIKTILGNL